ncbi:hypothetical protein CAter282_4234 [Collimonas arenae]|uniref:Uncharacterized protein n=1 Tax=Collimonas arenae TaxID=279058 RepID=A0A127QPJ6_9BURK|nr:hypothetical protein CAter10_4608 [Collimonas arenae]AMP11894.1 hypothetical protein CAter282_4234 [Collimonas arenae]
MPYMQRLNLHGKHAVHRFSISFPPTIELPGRVHAIQP